MTWPVRSVVVVALLVAACAGKSTEQVGREATDAMAELTRAQDDLARWFPEAVSSLAGAAMVDPAAGARRIVVDLLPRLDAFLAAAERALAAADAYLDRKPDPSVHPALDKLRRRVGVYNRVRKQLLDVGDELRKGDTSLAGVERIARRVIAIGVLLATAA